jgi:hypothetical protein
MLDTLEDIKDGQWRESLNRNKAASGWPQPPPEFL